MPSLHRCRHRGRDETGGGPGRGGRGGTPGPSAERGVAALSSECLRGRRPTSRQAEGRVCWKIRRERGRTRAGAQASKATGEELRCLKGVFAVQGLAEQVWQLRGHAVCSRLICSSHRPSSRNGQKVELGPSVAWHIC